MNLRIAYEINFLIGNFKRKKMENKGLLFIPDISGFTRFVNETEIEHSRLVIQELLEVLVNANEMGLQISEIEGDAILFYKFGEAPALEILYKQVAKMFCDFHRSLLAYEHRRYCHCAACNATINLTLKVVTHYGEFTGYNVRQFNKLIGKDIIVAHQLLKNNIELHEYWLVTESLLQHNPPADFTEWMQWMNSAKATETGEIPFLYTQLSQLKKELSQEPLSVPDITKKTRLLSLSREYETDIITLFNTSGDFNKRSRWQQGIKKTEEINHLLPRIGMRCRCIMENGETIIYSSSYSYQPDHIVFSETDESNNNSTYFTLQKTVNNTTRLTIVLYRNKNIFANTLFKLSQKKKTAAGWQKSLFNLGELLKAGNYK